MGGASLSGIIAENAISKTVNKVRYFLDFSIKFFEINPSCLRGYKHG
jgi:hypothetical protein